MDYSVQGDIRTPPDLGTLFSFRAFLLGEPPVRRPGCCEAHPLSSLVHRYSSVQLCGPRAGCTLTGLAPQRCLGFSWLEHVWMALLRLLLPMLKSPPDTRLMLPYLGGLCEAQVPWSADHSPSKTIQPQLSAGNTDNRSTVRGPMPTALGSRSTGLGKTVQ